MCNIFWRCKTAIIAAAADCAQSFAAAPLRSHRLARGAGAGAHAQKCRLGERALLSFRARFHLSCPTRDAGKSVEGASRLLGRALRVTRGKNGGRQGNYEALQGNRVMVSNAALPPPVLLARCDSERHRIAIYRDSTSATKKQ